MKILVVDDDGDVRTILRQTARRHGNNVIEARDGQEGLELAHKHRPGAIISDGLMPKMDGFQFLRAVKQDAILRTIPFVFYTAIYIGDKDYELALSLGADALIVKPSDPETFWKEFSSALEKRSRKKTPDVPGDMIERNEEYLTNYCNVVAASLETKVHELENIIAERNRTSAALAESEARYRLLFESNPRPMWVFDLETLAFLAVNGAAVMKYGYSREEFLAMTIKDIRPAEDVPALLEKVSRSREGFDEAGTWRHRKKGGTIIDVEITSHTLTFAGKKATLVMAIDVTEQRRLDLLIKNAANEWRSTFDAINEPIALLDNSGNILRCNKAMAKLAHKELHEMLGKHCWEIIHGTAGPVADCPLERMKRTGKRETLVSPLGERWYEVTADPFFDDRGNVVGAVHIMADVTERKQLEDVLKAAVVRAKDEKARSESIIAAIADGITIQDRDFRILYQNEAARKMIGDHVGELCYMAYEKRDQQCEGCGLAQVFKDGGTHVVERSAPTDRGLLYAEITASPLRDSKGNIIAGIEVVHNITERKRAEEALRASEEMHRLIFQGSPVGIFHYDIGLNITDCNDRFTEIVKTEREKLIGLDMHRLRDQRVIPSLETPLAGKEDRYEGGYQATTRAAEIWISMRTAPFFSQNGAVKGGIGIVEDITERKRAEDAVEHQKHFAEDLIQNSAIATFVLDAQHKVLIWNKACEELTGVPASEMIGTDLQWKPFYEQKRPVLADIVLDGAAEKLASLYQSFSRSVLTHEGFHAEGWYRNLNNKDRYIVFDAAPVHDSSGNVIAAIESVQDLTSRKKLEDQIFLTKQDWEETFNTITDMVTVHDKDFNIIRANKAAEKILGLSFLEAGRTKCFEYYHGTGCPPTGCPSCQSLVTGEPSTSELFEPHLNMFIEIRAIPRFDSHGRIAGLIHVVRDISERKKAQDELNDRVRQAALGAEIGFALTRGGDLRTILQLCADAMVKQLDAAFARIWTLNEQDNVLEMQASAGMYTHLNGPHGRVPVGRFKIGLIAEERKPHLTNEVVGDPRVGDQEWARNEGMVAFAGYPLIVQDRLVGVMAMFSRNRIPEATMSSLASVADVIALGIERKRTAEAMERYSKQLTALNTASSTLLASTSLTDIYQEICNIIYSVFDLKMVWLGIITEGSFEVKPAAHAGQEDGYLSTIRVTWDDSPFGRGPTGAAIKTRKPAMIHRDDPLYGPWQAEAKKRGYASSMAVPLLSTAGNCIGVLNFYGGTDSFSPDIMNLTQIFANQAAIAIENARLVEGLEEKVHERTKALEDTNVELQTVNKEIELRREEADAASRSKTDFLANMSHELRTPLNAILGFSDIMLQGMAGPVTDKQKEFLNDIAASGNHLLALITDILDLSKIEAGKTELELGEFSVQELIASSLIMFKEKALKHSIRVETDVDETIANITADHRKLKQVMVNLLSNAFKFTPDGGSVRVAARRVQSSELGVRSVKDSSKFGVKPPSQPPLGKGGIEGGVVSEHRAQHPELPEGAYSELRTQRSELAADFIEISVADTGIGISPENQKKLFQPFQQVETSLTRKYSGTGLGLSLCRRFVELHGGGIHVESEPGKGSTFIFTIPMRK